MGTGSRKVARALRIVCGILKLVKISAYGQDTGAEQVIRGRNNRRFITLRDKAAANNYRVFLVLHPQHTIGISIGNSSLGIGGLFLDTVVSGDVQGAPVQSNAAVRLNHISVNIQLACIQIHRTGNGHITGDGNSLTIDGKIIQVQANTLCRTITLHRIDTKIIAEGHIGRFIYFQIVEATALRIEADCLGSCSVQDHRMGTGCCKVIRTAGIVCGILQLVKISAYGQSTGAEKVIRGTAA